MLYKIATKVARHLGYFWKKICRQEIKKIAQSGHAASKQAVLCVFNAFNVERKIPDRGWNVPSRSVYTGRAV